MVSVSVPIEIEVHTVPHFKAPVNGMSAKGLSVMLLLHSKTAL